MGVITYALMTYGMTAVISLGVVGVIVLVNKLCAPRGEEEEK